MADKIKKFFSRKKADAKFKTAGPGRRLTDNPTSSSAASNNNFNINNQQRTGAPSITTSSVHSAAKEQAAQAALLRLNQQKPSNTAFNTSFGAIQAQVRRELEAERLQRSNASIIGSTSETTSSRSSNSVEPSSPYLVAQGVFYRCPLISDEILSKEEWRPKIKDFLFSQLEEERGLTACLIINSCNYNRIKVQECIEVLVRYLDNIIANPDEVKFQKIRCSNTTYRDKVEPVLGVDDFLFAAGFRRETLELNGTSEEFLVFNIDNIDSLETLQMLRDAIKSENRVELELDRNVQVLSPAQANKLVHLPADFYSLTADELRREQQLRTENVDVQLQLRTKAMREREEQRKLKPYKFAVIRVRFADGLYLQGTFSVYERFVEVVKFVEQNLENAGLPFDLYRPSGHAITEPEYESTLLQLKLLPNVVLTFQWDASIADQVAAAGPCQYLKSNVLLLVKSL